MCDRARSAHSTRPAPLERREAIESEIKTVAAGAFREPVATLIAGDKTVGRHFAGPTWALDDGGAITGKPVASAPGAEAGDIPLLKLAVTDNRVVGVLKDVTTVLRLDTHGDVLKGACDAVGALRAGTYSAAYSFWR